LYGHGYGENFEFKTAGNILGCNEFEVVENLVEKGVL